MSDEATRVSETYSGIILDQPLSLPYTFSLPADYVRGGSIVPPLTGFQVFGTVADPETASITYSLSHRGVALATGTSIGQAAVSGPAWFSVYFPPVDLNTLWVNDSFTLTATVSGISTSGGRIRILAGVADSGRDFLGNIYRSVVSRSPATQISILDDANSFWLSQPTPSQSAVQALYFDVREGGGSSVIDRITIDPLTPGIDAHFYVSKDPNGPGLDADSWDALLWEPVHDTLKLDRKETFALPEPVVTDYVKVEFTNLQPQYYDPGHFPVPTVYRKHPQWVLDYFLTIYDQEEIDILSPGVNVAYDALLLGYTYNDEDLRHAPDLPPLSLTDGSQQNSFIRPDNTNKADPASLQRVNINFSPFTNAPSKLVDATKVLGSFSQSGATDSYSTETIQDLKADVSVTSTHNRESLLVEKSFPSLYFHIPCRHAYKIVEASFDQHIGYFAGIKTLQFHREVYTLGFDHEQYIEVLGDTTNTQINDFSQDSPRPRA